MTGAEILERLQISEIFNALGGEVRGRRGRAFWRRGDGWNISLDDDKGAWFDHRDGIGGGVVDLIVKVRGCSRGEALHWLAELVGLPLDGRESGPRVTQQAAEDWRRGLLDRLAGRLDRCKADALSADNPPEVLIAEIRTLSGLESDLRTARNVRERYCQALARNRSLALEVAAEGQADRVDAEEWAIACVRFLELAESGREAVAA